jgi:hypothetical protein
MKKLLCRNWQSQNLNASESSLKEEAVSTMSAAAASQLCVPPEYIQSQVCYLLYPVHQVNPGVSSSVDPSWLSATYVALSLVPSCRLALVPLGVET